VRSHFSGFTLSNIQIHELKDESELVVEYHSEGRVDGTDKVYVQDYISRLVVENGKIKLLREYLNIISSAQLDFAVAREIELLTYTCISQDRAARNEPLGQPTKARKTQRLIPRC
jgi:hypothetical protein